MDLKETAILGDRVGEHWYYRSKSAALRNLIGEHLNGGSVLDVGAGAGYFARDLVHHGLTREVICVDPGYADDRDEPVADGILRFRREVDSTDSELALFMDVLEHVDDDVGLLRHYARLLGPGHLVAITVPAFQWLWSDHDVFLEHRRRYSLRGLERVVGEAGLIVVQGNYFFGAVLPIASAVRLSGRVRTRRSAASSLKQHSPLANRVLAGVCQIEVHAQRHNRLGGLTVMALAVTR